MVQAKISLSRAGTKYRSDLDGQFLQNDLFLKHTMKSVHVKAFLLELGTRVKSRCGETVSLYRTDTISIRSAYRVDDKKM